MKLANPWRRSTRLFHLDLGELGARAPPDWNVVDSLGAAVIARYHIFGIGRETMLVQVQPLDFSLGRDAQPESALDRIHQRDRHDEGRNRDREASDHLGLQHTNTTAVKEPGHHRACVRTGGCWRTVEAG